MKINKSKITIGLPLYNGEKTLRRTLDSLLQQTFTDFILIISDNGSTDSSSKICLEYQKKDNRIKYFFKKNTVSWVWNFIFLVDKADTEYFVWVADDDYWEKDFIEKNISFLNSNPKYVGSVSDVKHFGKYLDNYLIDKNEKFNFVHPIAGTLDEKITKHVDWSNISMYAKPVFENYGFKLLATRSIAKSAGSNKILRQASTDEKTSININVVDNQLTVNSDLTKDLLYFFEGSSVLKFIVCNEQPDNFVGAVSVPVNLLIDNNTITTTIDFKWPEKPLLLYKSNYITLSTGEKYDTE